MAPVPPYSNFTFYVSVICQLILHVVFVPDELWLVVIVTICFVQMVQEMGNSRARAVYEANVPDDFRRPQSD